MKVFVVMGNDYPDSVFEDQNDADKYCVDKMKKQKEENLASDSARGFTRGKIYYRWYEFDLIRKTPGEPIVAAQEKPSSGSGMGEIAVEKASHG